MDLSGLGIDVERHEKLIKWATERKVFIDGVVPAKLPNKGLGIVATRKIEKDEILIRVPQGALLKINPDEKIFSKNFEECSVHGRVARRLIARDPDGNRQFDEWIGAMPSYESLKLEMPCLWSKSLHKFLPDMAKGLLDHQTKKMNKDLERITNAEFKARASSQDELRRLQEEFKYAWLLVNTRCFYWDYPDLDTRKSLSKTKRPRLQLHPKQKQRHRDDCMALNPFVDYFNHSPDNETVRVSFSIDGFQVEAMRDIEPDEELHVSYGKHSNDFLLVEYGFMVPRNEDDSVKIDSWVLPMLSSSQKELLDRLGFLGDYTVSAHDLEVCYRTQTALRSTVVPSGRLEAHVHGVEDLSNENTRKASKKGSVVLSELEVQREVTTKVKQLLHNAIEDAEHKLTTLKDGLEEADTDSQGVATLVVRWEEILSMLRRTLDKSA